MFAHLHVHSEFSSLDGMSRVDDLFRRAAELGQEAIAITDHGNLGAAWRAQAAADKHGVRFIPGIEAYVAIGSRYERESIEIDSFDADEDGKSQKRSAYYHLTLLARSPRGWQNLLAINNEGHRNVAGRGQLVDWEFLEQHHEGLVALTGCLGGPVLSHLAAGDEQTARENLERLHGIFGDRLGVEVMEHGIRAESAALARLAEIAAEYGLPLVATNDSHFTHEHDQHAHTAWLCVDNKSTVDAPKFAFHGAGYWVRSEDEMRALRPEPWWHDAVTNAGRIAAAITERVVPEPKRRLPKAPIPDGWDDGPSYLQHLIREGIEQRYGRAPGSGVVERVREEWRTIAGMGFVDYFLIVHEMISWARGQGILVGPGRGSAAGSIVAYALGITQVDPLEYELLFERFLEPGRAELPDIDIDFESRRRGEVIEHLRELYGRSNVAAIGNVMQVQSKQALKDAARAMGANKVGEELAKAIPDKRPLPAALQERDEETREFHEILDRDTTARQIARYAAAFYRVMRSWGVHASGIIVSSEPLPEIVPVRIDRKTGGIVAEWDMQAVEQFGLVKIDMLGLRNLDIAKASLTEIARQTGEQFGLYDIPHPDLGGDRVAAAWDVLQAGRTAGLFQLESPKMTELVRQVHPQSLEHLSSVVALFRPGPLSAGMHEAYARRKNGLEDVTYQAFTSDPVEEAALAEVMGTTYGTLIYQEQIMLLGRVVAGFDDVWRSKLRRAVSKKKADLMAEVGDRFLAGAVVEHADPDGAIYSPAFSVETANRVWDAMKGAAEYAFNKAHSAAYAQLAYYTAFLKASWPAIYGAATLQVTDKDDKRILAIQALRGEGITIEAPSVNASGLGTAATGQAVRFGLAEVKDVGATAAEAIVAERERGGPYASMQDVFERVRVGDKALSTGVMGALIAAGALDEFGPRRGLLRAMNAWWLVPDIPDDEFGLLERAARQRSALLTSLGTHPAMSIRDELATATIENSNRYEVVGTPVGALADTDAPDQTPVIAVGLLSSYSERPYAKGKFARMTLEDERGSVAMIMWESSRRRVVEHGHLPRIGWPCIVSGRLNTATFVDPETDETSTSTEITVFDLRAIPIDDRSHR